MKSQWTLILALVFALIVAIFAVINVNPVEVQYLFGTASWPLILVILGSAVMGAIAAVAAGIFRLLQQQKRMKQLQKENEALQKKVHEHEENEQLRKQNYELGQSKKLEQTKASETEENDED
jgi:putative membrane protein